jgi:hypothetical protein
MARLMRSISIPRPKTSVATQILLLNSLNSLNRLILFTNQLLIQDLHNESFLPFLLTNTRMDGNGWEVALAQQLIQFCSPDGALNEDDDLVECHLIKQLIELSVLLLLIQLDVELLETV